ncbi:hypothetical protein B7Z17_00585 [Candidatus Saccharibacteria bacterium 32-49-10]|nr:MAG: hypothetical protein B7Z17_00585 [Candidatus Saccharibacteria bacterium 32-49-10]
MSDSHSLTEMIEVAKLATTTALSTKLTGDGRVIVHLRTTNGRQVDGASSILLPAGCQMVIDAFDPDGSIRANAQAVRERRGLRTPADIALYRP